MKRIKFFFRLIAALLIIQIYACEKIIENLPGKPKNCRIKRILYHSGYNGDYYGNFYYNKWGNPDSVIHGYVGLVNTNQYFKYNNKRQLIEAIYGWGGGKEQWHKFVYTNGIITSDTVYTFASNEEPEPLHYVNKLIVYFEYDNFGRIIKETRDLLYPVRDRNIWTYSYDANGNRNNPYEPNFSYDNYTNIHVLHPIWQFLSRDYSLNNPFHAVSYNNFRLPTKLNSEAGFNFLVGVERSMAGSEIEYECK